MFSSLSILPATADNKVYTATFKVYGDYVLYNDKSFRCEMKVKDYDYSAPFDVAKIYIIGKKIRNNKL